MAEKSEHDFLSLLASTANSTPTWVTFVIGFDLIWRLNGEEVRKVTVNTGSISRCLMFSISGQRTERVMKQKSFGGRIGRVRVEARVSEIKFSTTQKRVNKNKAAHIGIYEPWRHPRMITLNLKSTLISFFSPYISLWLRCRAHKYKHLNIPPCALAERAANFF